MRIRRLLILAAGLFFAASGTSGAQETGKAGITIAYPASIGVIWHATDTVAIRPVFTFAHNSSETEPSTAESDSSVFGLDLGVLFYLKKYDTVRTYVSPRFTYQRMNTTTTSGSTQTTLPEIESTANTTGGAGTFGAYTPTPVQRLRRSGWSSTTGIRRSDQLDSAPSSPIPGAQRPAWA